MSVEQPLFDAEVNRVFPAARPGDLQRSVLNASRAERELGWQAKTMLADRLARTWDWMQTPALT